MIQADENNEERSFFPIHSTLYVFDMGVASHGLGEGTTLDCVVLSHLYGYLNYGFSSVRM